MKKTLLVSFICVIILGWSLQARVPTQKDEDYLRKIFLIEADKYNIPEGAIQLRSIQIFPRDDESGDSLTIGDAGHFAQDREGRIFIPDRLNSEVLVFNAQGEYQFSFGRRGQGPGEFIRPSNLFIWDDRILVRDASTMRFQFFDMNGRFLRGFNAFKGYNSFVASGKRMFAAPVLSRPPESKNGSSLIEVMDLDGIVLKSFGVPLDVPKYDYSLLNSVRLAIGDDESLIVAFQFFPIIRKYTMEGSLIKEIRLESGISEKIFPINEKMIERRYRGEQVPYGYIINNIYANKDGLYIAATAPRFFEIILLNQEGKRIEYYYRKMENAIGCFGIMVRKKGDEKEFIILRMYPETIVEVMIGKKNDVK
jgi:hypothetical protein